MEYSYEVEFADKIDRSCADFLSRLPVSGSVTTDAEEKEMKEYNLEKILVISSENKLKTLTALDNGLKHVLTHLRSSWPIDDMNMDSELKSFWKHRGELTEEEGIVLRFDRIVIPKDMRRSVLETLHSGHP